MVEFSVSRYSLILDIYRYWFSNVLLLRFLYAPFRIPNFCLSVMLVEFKVIGTILNKPYISLRLCDFVGLFHLFRFQLLKENIIIRHFEIHADNFHVVVHVEFERAEVEPSVFFIPDYFKGIMVPML
jgi:hypothetical protein